MMPPRSHVSSPWVVYFAEAGMEDSRPDEQHGLRTWLRYPHGRGWTRRLTEGRLLGALKGKRVHGLYHRKKFWDT